MDEKFWRTAAARDAIASRPYNRSRPGFPRACRLLHRPEYERVYRSGKRRSNRLFTLHFAPNGLECSRFGMSVGRALGGAVLRNRIRRRVREILRHRRQEISSGWDIILHPRGTVATVNFAELGNELISLLQSAVGAAVPTAPPALPHTAG